MKRSIIGNSIQSVIFPRGLCKSLQDLRLHHDWPVKTEVPRNSLIPVLSALAVSLLLFFSCSLTETAGSGSLQLPDARSITTTDSGTPYVMRYSLARNGNTVKMNGSEIIEARASEKIMVENLVPGSGYVLSLSVGERQGKNLMVKYLGSSESFAITEGSTTAVSLKLRNAPEYAFLTKNGAVSSAVQVVRGETARLYVLDGMMLRAYRGTEGGDPFDAERAESLDLSTTNLSGLRVNSLSRGLFFASVEDPGTIGEELWLNTSAGLYRMTWPLALEGPSTLATAKFVLNMPALLKPSVQLSDAVQIGTEILALYSAGMTDFGLLFANKQTDFARDDTWKSIATAKDDYPEIEDLISTITKDIILDLSVNRDGSEEITGSDIYYLATPLGTVIGSMDLDKEAKKTAFEDDPIGTLKDYWLKVGDGSIPIKRVAGAGNRVYAGTDKGLYTDVINTFTGKTESGTGIPAGAPLNGLALVDGTAGRGIVAVRAVKVPGEAGGSDFVVAAAVTAKNAVLIVKDSAVVEEIPATAGMPAGSKPFLFVHPGTKTVCVVLSGANGSVIYDTKIVADGQIIATAGG